MTDGGKGNCTSKYYTEKELEEYSLKISKSNKGKPKPKGFSENLSKLRKGLNNPATKEMIDWIVAFKDEEFLVPKWTIAEIVSKTVEEILGQPKRIPTDEEINKNEQR